MLTSETHCHWMLPAQQRSQNSEQTYGHAVPYQMLRERFRPCSRTPSQLLWASDPYRSSTDYADWSGEQKGHRNGHRAQSSGLLTVIHSLQKRCLDLQREGGITQSKPQRKEERDRARGQKNRQMGHRKGYQMHSFDLFTVIYLLHKHCSDSRVLFYRKVNWAFFLFA